MTSLFTISLATVGGVGGLVALVVAYRKQATNELQQSMNKHNEVNKKLTDAVHLLGEDSPSTRIAGIYALINVGDRYPDQRQQIINILFGYLRTKREDDGPTESTIIAILKSRLNKESWTSDRDIDLDLHGATITERLDLRDIKIHRLVFDKVTVNNIIFSRATCDDATFNDKATFNNEAWFDNATFNGIAAFDTATFNELAAFDHTAFNGDVSFDRTTFNSASFDHTAFNREALFHDTKFNQVLPDTATFRGVKFKGKTTFCNNRLPIGDVPFGELVFNGTPFDSVEFKDEITFKDITFKGETTFRNTTFDNVTFDDKTVVERLRKDPMFKVPPHILLH